MMEKIMLHEVAFQSLKQIYIISSFEEGEMWESSHTV